MNDGLKYIDIVWAVLNSWYVKFAEISPRLIVGILVFIFFLKTSKYLSKITVKLVHNFFPDSNKQSTAVALVGVFRFLIILMGTFISLEIMNFSGFLWKFVGSLGVAGVIAGVALKDLVSSIFSGMLVGIDKSFKVGDYITLGAHSGTVTEIGFLTTKLINDEGKKVYIPNQTIFNAPFYNITASPQRKIIFDFDIPASEDLQKAKECIFDVIKNLDQADRLESADVIFTSLKQGTFNIQVKFWISIGQNVADAKSDALLKIKERLDKENILLTSPTSISIENSKSKPDTN
ncbi:mechanosensitive ion channel protein MscS [Elizabethkingia meningoseptica]|uniref:Mechanosensitive ion channel protein MscS n=1 Tax=Elizabethkingia meningoseptica TaxID=238 RepID=A0A1V3U5K3_ELIME|nr:MULTISPECIES: mechanosensitive ion channel family protein [Elizabethkingia]AQX11288.1 mechanosensitive ion channel protein MscS [Elizabethkingia meningoseptica]EJK5329818.1 mechanosensitive ion channel family protein [Elizabethkingia meningoseptica]MBG0512632.1 mechanosensitive ion channel family protein [Elizabethkingia meningoseptica]MDE5432227.1 mechanosensitive ion channel family protein [Elizabethkingia meningoseptica]MDE5435234.1 mechanosensitive ion channel family protein [Elizabethk